MASFSDGDEIREKLLDHESKLHQRPYTLKHSWQAWSYRYLDRPWC